MTGSQAPVPHWPGEFVRLGKHEKVWLARTPPVVNEPKNELVLCVHGMTGSATNWTDLLAELAPDFDGAAVDLPGSGFSPPPRRGSGYSIGALAGTVIRLIEQLGKPVHLIGNSLGGAVCVRVAARRPDLIRTLTLAEPALPDLRVRTGVAHFPLLALPFVGERLIRTFGGKFPVESRVKSAFETCCYDPQAIHPDRFALEVEALTKRDTLPYNAYSVARAARTLVRETLTPGPLNLWHAATKVRAPALVLYGSHDRLVNPRMAERAKQAFRNARVEVLPETAHLAQMERPALMARLFREMVGQSRTPGNDSRRDQVDA